MLSSMARGGVDGAVGGGLLPSPSSAATVLALPASHDAAASTGAGLPVVPHLVGAMDGGGEPLLVPLGMGRRAMAGWAAGAGDLAWPRGGDDADAGFLVASVWGLNFGLQFSEPEILKTRKT